MGKVSEIRNIRCQREHVIKWTCKISLAGQVRHDQAEMGGRGRRRHQQQGGASVPITPARHGPVLGIHRCKGKNSVPQELWPRGADDEPRTKKGRREVKSHKKCKFVRVRASAMEGIVLMS